MSIIVYDIQVKDVPEFFANGILVHNCPICEPLNGMTVTIKGKFLSDPESIEATFQGLHPPAHALCRCSVDYDFISSSEFIRKDASIYGRITELFHKVKGTGGPEYKVETKGVPKVQNPNAVWAGGESLVGPDKEVANISVKIKELSGDKKKRALQSARDELTDEGYVQLRLSLGLTAKINPKE